MIIWIELNWLKLFPNFVFFCRVKGHGIIECPKIDSEVRDAFVRHLGQQILERDYVEQPYNQQREQIQNYVDEKMDEIFLGERLFVQNKLMTSNSPSVSRI